VLHRCSGDERLFQNPRQVKLILVTLMREINNQQFWQLIGNRKVEDILLTEDISPVGSANYGECTIKKSKFRNVILNNNGFVGLNINDCEFDSLLLGSQKVQKPIIINGSIINRLILGDGLSISILAIDDATTIKNLVCNGASMEEIKIEGSKIHFSKTSQPNQIQITNSHDFETIEIFSKTAHTTLTNVTCPKISLQIGQSIFLRNVICNNDFSLSESSLNNISLENCNINKFSLLNQSVPMINLNGGTYNEFSFEKSIIHKLNVDSKSEKTKFKKLIPLTWLK